MSILPVLFAFAYSVVANVNYDATHGTACKGDLYLPSQVKSTTPMVLVIHGGGWNTMDRTAMNGVADLFAKDFGFAVFNIDYRLAGSGARWPACGDDCVAAANFILSDEFRQQYGFVYDKIWIVGASAGGHLALWTHVKLAAEKVAGTIAISPIGDPAPDYALWPSRYAPLFDASVDVEAMNPIAWIAPGMAPVLITHVADDGVVPIASSKNFAAAYADAGNCVEYCEYERDVEPNEGGHCIWRKESSPHKLIATIERRIANFVSAAIPAGSEKIARSLHVASTSRRSDGSVDTVTLAFGSGNGLGHRLWVAYGDTYGGERMSGWEHCDFVADIADGVDSYTASVPSADKVKFFLQVAFPGNAYAVPVKYIEGTGKQYIDTGLKVSGGDTLKCLFRCTKDRDCIGGIMGTRAGASDKNVTSMQNNSQQFVDYNSSDYNPYRASMSKVYVDSPYEIVLSAAVRMIRNVDNGVVTATNGTYCGDVFTSDYNVFVFKHSGINLATENCAQGKMEYYTHERNGEYLASYVPYRVGSAENGVYGFLDRVSGAFKQSETATGFLGGEETDEPDVMASATETLQKTAPLHVARRVTSLSVVTAGGIKRLNVAFDAAGGAGCSNRLYLVWDKEDKGRNRASWSHSQYVGVIEAHESEKSIAIPPRARFCRVVTTVPFEGEDILEPLLLVYGSGSGYYDLGVTIRGGDEIQARLRPQALKATLFGSRLNKTGETSLQNVVAALGDNKFVLDYTNSDILGHRFSATVPAYTAQWYDLTLAPGIRHVRTVTGESMGSANETVCSDEFETAHNCWLFYASGNPSVDTKFSGWVSGFSIRRAGSYAVSLSPCKKGDVCGFYDRARGMFLAPVTGTFVGKGEPADASPLVSVSQAVQMPPRGLIIVIE